MTKKINFSATECIKSRINVSVISSQRVFYAFALHQCALSSQMERPPSLPSYLSDLSQSALTPLSICYLISCRGMFFVRINTQDLIATVN